jgi:hypothetical protein
MAGYMAMGRVQGARVHALDRGPAPGAVSAPVEPAGRDARAGTAVRADTAVRDDTAVGADTAVPAGTAVRASTALPRTVPRPTLRERWEGLREELGMMTFFLLDPESWR